MSDTEGIKMKPHTPLSCALYSIALSLIEVLAISLIILKGSQINHEKLLAMYLVLPIYLVIIMTVVAFGHGFGSNDEKFIFLVKGKRSPLMRTRTVRFNRIKEVQITKNGKNRIVQMKVITGDKIYYLGQRRVMDRFVAILSAKKMNDKIRETKEDLSLLQHFRYWWRDGEVEVKR